MPNFVEQIYEFNQKAGLLDKPYNDYLESSFQIEEALEGFNLPCIIEALDIKLDFDTNAKGISREILASVKDNCISDVDRLDKACDAIVFAVGSIAKLGLTPDQICQAVSIVMEANLAKLGMPKDEHGKLMKPADFVGPEVKLQQLLESR